MNRWMDRMKHGLRRVGDWISGNDQEVAIDPQPPELLDGRPSLRPRCDVWESPDEIMVVADVPGARPDTTALSCYDGRLTVVARPDVDPLPPLAGDAFGEAYQARFDLPREVDERRVRATLRDGVLTIRLPKHPRPAARRIPIRAA